MPQLKEKMKVVILPTKKASNIVLNPSNKLYIAKDIELEQVLKHNIGTPQHLYITTNEKHKTDDIILVKYNSNEYCIGKAKCDSNDTLPVNPHCKIIASTDSTLGLPLIPDGFVKKYVHLQGNIKEVMIGICDVSLCPICARFGCKQHPKVDSHNYITISRVKDTYTSKELCHYMGEYNKYAHNEFKSGRLPMKPSEYIANH